MTVELSSSSISTSMRFSALSTFYVVLMLATICNVGCSDSERKTYPVRGIVRFPDGKVLREGSVEFEIIGRKDPITATGVIGPDGSFVLGTYELDDGALAGKHRVVVIADYVIGSGAERPGLIPESTLDPRYRDYRRSGLVHEVKPDTNNIVIEVEYAKVADGEQE
jgi:hypothetical protein